MSKAGKDVRIVARVDEDTARWLEQRASDRETSTAAVIRWAIRTAMRAEVSGKTRVSPSAPDRAA